MRFSIKPIPASATLKTVAIYDSVYDKGNNGAVLNMIFETRDEKGELVFENKTVLLDRSAGNFDGDRGPKNKLIVPPEGIDPDFCVESAMAFAVSVMQEGRFLTVSAAEID